MPQKVILSADSTCDLSAALIERYQVHMYPLHIPVSYTHLTLPTKLEV